MVYAIISLLFIFCLSQFIEIFLRFRGTVYIFWCFPVAFHFVINCVGVMHTLVTGVTSVGIAVPGHVTVTVTYEFFLSYIVLLFALRALFAIIRSSQKTHACVLYANSSIVNRVDRRLLGLSFLLLGFDCFYFGIPPGIELLVAGPEAAALAKGEILIEKSQSGIPIVGYWVRYVPYFGFVHCMIRWFIGDQVGVKFLLAYMCIFFSYSALSLLKSYMLVPLSFFLFGLVFYQFRFRQAFLTVSCLVCFGLLIFWFGSAGEAGVLNRFLIRVFLAQADGMFLMRDLFDSPAVGAALYSSPLRHFLDVQTFDPAVVIVERFFGRGLGWVNMNSFYVGQAWIMFGIFYIFLIPFIMFIQYLASYYVLERFLGKGRGVFLVPGLLIFSPLSNNIANLVWMKELYACFLLLPLLYFASKRII